MYNTLNAYKNGTLATMVATHANELTTKYGILSVTGGDCLSAAYYAREAQKENSTLYNDMMNGSTEAEELYYWLKEDAADTINGYLISITGTRSLLYDVEEYDVMIERLNG